MIKAGYFSNTLAYGIFFYGMSFSRANFYIYVPIYSTDEPFIVPKENYLLGITCTEAKCGEQKYFSEGNLFPKSVDLKIACGLVYVLCISTEP